MRNFKKFLALVLAMLMVSACAVSVSAAYADQAAIDATGCADAVAVLSDLGVIKGDGENFRPEGTLTRAEAAVIAAKLYAGADGQKFDWTAATTSFVDVDAAWSFAYINYVSQRGIMDGVGDGKFNPNGTLTLAQALTIAVKVAGLQSEVADLTKNSTPAYWAAHWIAVAGKYEFDKGINAWDYDAACSRATMAQIAYNVLNYKVQAGVTEEGVAVYKYPFVEKFDLKQIINGGIIEVTDKAVVVLYDGTRYSFDLASFNAKLSEGTAADYLRHYVDITYADKANVIYNVEVNTTAKTFTYADKLLANVLDKDNKPTNEIVLDGVTYNIGTSGSAVEKNDGIGSGTSVKNSIFVLGLDENNAVPTYYKAVAFDDNNDDKYDRLAIDTYEIVVLADGKTVKVDDKDVQVTKIMSVNGEELDSIVGATFTGLETTYGEAPVLAYVNGKNVDVLELAEKVTGVVSSVKYNAAEKDYSKNYITVGGTAYKFAEAFEVVPSWTLGQNVTIYTINGKYVDVASADTGVESGMVEKTVLVDKVAIEDGKAVISGYYHGAAFEAVTLKVAGIESANRLVARNAYLNDKGNAIDYNKDGKVDDADKAFVAVALGTNKKDDGTIENALVLEDNTFYDVKITSAGAYIVAKSAKTVPATTTSAKAISISGSYIKEDTTAIYRLADSYVIVAEKPADTTKAYDYYADTYVVSANGAISANTDLTYGVVKADYTAVAEPIKDKVALVYIKGATAAPEAPKTVAALADGMTIVWITSVESESLDFNTYNAIDIFTGEAVTVTGTATVGNYVTVAEGKVVVDGTKWIGTHAITLNTVLGQIESVHAYNSYLAGEKDGADAVLTPAEAKDANKVVFGLDNVTIWKVKDGALVADTEFKYDGKTSIYGFINGGKVVILPTPVEA